MSCCLRFFRVRCCSKYNSQCSSSRLGLGAEGRTSCLPAPLDAITDVGGVAVGSTTIIRGDNIRTGITAIVPHPGNLYREKVPAGIFVGNGFGKLTGTTQVDEMGDIETPILLTSTTSVPRVADALISYMLALPATRTCCRSILWSAKQTMDISTNPRPSYFAAGVFAAIKNAKGGPVEEGAVGAGTGTVVFGWKGGIGTSSRRLPTTSADIPWACWYKQISEACSPSRALRWAKSWANIICVKNLSRR